MTEFRRVLFRSGSRTRIKVVKNKIAPPFKEAEFDIMFGEGISREGDILDLAAELSIINKSGAWYAYNGEKIGQGRDNAKKYLKENPAVFEEIDAAVRKHYNLENGEKTDEPSSASDTDDKPEPKARASKSSRANKGAAEKENIEKEAEE